MIAEQSRALVEVVGRGNETGGQEPFSYVSPRESKGAPKRYLVENLKAYGNSKGKMVIVFKLKFGSGTL